MAHMIVNGERVAVEIVSTRKFDNGGQNVKHVVKLLAPVQGCQAGEVVEGDLYSKVSPRVARMYGVKVSIIL